MIQVERQGAARGCDGGQVLPLLLVVVLLAGVVGLGLVRVAVASAHRSSAQAAADAAALAGAAEGEDAARRLATANDAEVLSYRSDGMEVEVVVRRREVVATARARLVFEARTFGRLRFGDLHPVSSPPCQPTVRDPPPGRFRPTLPGRATMMPP